MDKCCVMKRTIGDNPIRTCAERSRSTAVPPVYTEVAAVSERALTQEGREAAAGTTRATPRALIYDFLIAKYGNKNPVHPIENKRRRPSLIANFRDCRISRPASKSNFPYAVTHPRLPITKGAIPCATFRVVAAWMPANLLDTPCRVKFDLTRSKQRIGAIAKCHTSRGSVSARVEAKN
jgi:hypothetical protein